MSLKKIRDRELLSQIKMWVQNERQLLVQILRHLQEIERRLLFSELGYSSLFAYAVNELRYSEGQAGRRIQAMRLLKEIPEVETKIGSGELSLTNLSQAQSYFREVKKKNLRPLPLEEKREVLDRLENKSSREGQKVLVALSPDVMIPKERERVVSESLTEISFIMDETLRKSLEELRSLLGSKGAHMNLAELIQETTDISIAELKKKKFGVKQMKREVGENKNLKNTPAQDLSKRQNSRYISKKLKYEVWSRDCGKCTKCSSRRYLNYDHIKPIALGGETKIENLRLLCFHCNQRQAQKTFGEFKIPNHIQNSARNT